MYSEDSYISGSNLEYTRKNVKDWYGDDCLDWASDAERELNIPLSKWVSIDGFQKVTGRDLLRFSSKDFRKLVNEEYGPHFYKIFKKLVKERKEDKASSKCNLQNFGLSISESTTWTVPQLELSSSDLDIPLTDNGNSYGNDLSSSYDSYSNSANCLSPTFGAPSYGGTPYSYNGLSPSYGSVSPTFGAQPRSFDAYDRDRENDSRTPTYFTQPSILSGGSISYGPCEGSADFTEISQDVCNSSFDNGYSETSNYGGYSSLLPDFNSLMIEDGLAAASSNFDIDIDDLDASFTEETFSDLDQYIHSENIRTNTEFEQLNEGQENLPNERKKKEGKASLLSSDQGSLEECMLKKITTGKRGNRVRHPQSWEFLVRLLMNPKSNPSLIKWEDKKNGIFRLVQKEEIAKLWGKRSQKHKDEPLAYDNFARILRYHYRSKILLPVSDKHLVYKLGDKVLENLKSQGLLQI